MPRRHGRKGQIMIGGSGDVGAVASLPNMSSFSFNNGAEFADATSFDDDNGVELKGLPGMSGTLEGFFDDDNDVLYQAADSDDPVYLYLYPTRLNMARYWFGPAWIDVQTSVAVRDAIKITANFRAAGTWSKKTRD